MLIQALLVGIWAGICSLDDGGFQTQIRKPLLAGTITGLLLGDITQGLIIGGTLELMWLGVNTIGAYNPPDVTGGAIVGVVVGITSGAGVAGAVALAVPAATLIQQLIILLQTYMSVHIHRELAEAKYGDFDKVNRWHLYGGVLLFLARAVPCFVAVYLGNTVLSAFIDWLPDFIMTGLNAASGIIPAVGISMLLTMMLKKNMWMYMVAGFVLAAYLNLPILGVSIVGVVLAGIYDYNYVQRKKIEGSVQAQENGGYDL